MPLINKIGGGGGSSKAPVTGYVMPTSASQIRIEGVENVSKVKSLILYAIHETSVSTNRSVVSMFCMFDDTHMVYETTNNGISQATTLITTCAYEEVSVIIPPENILTTTFGDNYIDMSLDLINHDVSFDFDTELKYAYILYY